MISDVCFEMAKKLDRYLTDPFFFDDSYQGAIRAEIIRLRDEAVFIIRVLDTPLDAPALDREQVMKEIEAERLLDHANLRQAANELPDNVKAMANRIRARLGIHR